MFLVYICILWLASMGPPPPTPKASAKGLSAAELERLPGVEDGGHVRGTECAVCLDDVEDGQAARVMPVCRHVFHRSCADAWLSANAVCPMCRVAMLPPHPTPEDAQQVVDGVLNSV